MYILALDDERYALDSIAQELEQVFPGAVIHEETKASAAIAWSKSLAESGKKLYMIFLSCLHGSEHQIGLDKPMFLFLSCLHGSEPDDHAKPVLN